MSGGGGDIGRRHFLSHYLLIVSRCLLLSLTVSPLPQIPVYRLSRLHSVYLFTHRHPAPSSSAVISRSTSHIVSIPAQTRTDDPAHIGIFPQRALPCLPTKHRVTKSLWNAGNENTSGDTACTPNIYSK